MGRGWLVRDGLSYLVSKAVPGLAGLASVVVFIRMMGREEYGRYALAFTLANAASMFCLGWLSQAILRYRSQLTDHELTRRAIRSGLTISLAAGIVGLLAVFAANAFGGAYSAVTFGTILLLFTSLSVFLVRSALFQAELRPSAVVKMGIAQSILSVTLPVILFLVASATHPLAIAGLAVSYLIPALWGAAWLLRGATFSRASSSDSAAGPLLREFWRYGRALSVWMAVTALLQLSDRHFIQSFWGFEAAGDYAATYDLVFRGFTLALSPITLAVHPRMMKHWNANQEAEAWSVWRSAIAVQVGIFLCVLIPAIWLPDLVGLIVGTDGEALELVWPLLAGGFLWQLCMLAHKPLELAARTSSMLVGAFAALAVNLGLNLFILPRYGSVVSAQGTIASSVAYMVVVLALGARAHRSSVPA